MSKQKYIVMDVAACHDCNNCFMACKDEHVGNDWMPYTEEQPRHGHRWVRLLRTERGQCPRIDVAYLTLLCQHCERCAVVDAGYAVRRCDGLVMLCPEQARGHEEIPAMCPYGAVFWNEEKEVPQKCTMCAHITDGGQQPGMPRCVHSCPTEALRYYEVEPEEMAQIIGEQELETYRPEFGTKPHVYYKNLYRFTKCFISGEVVDKKTDDCLENAAVTLRGDDVEETQRTDCFGEFKFDALEPGTYTLEVNGKPVQTVDLTTSLNVGELFV